MKKITLTVKNKTLEIPYSDKEFITIEINGYKIYTSCKGFIALVREDMANYSDLKSKEPLLPAQ